MQTEQKCRGTIVVDTCALYELAAPVKQNCWDPQATKKISHYIEMLPFLARHGFKIIIPEMISVEAEGVLATGKHLSTYFRHKKEIPEKRFDAPVLVEFLQKAANNQFPNIHVLAVNGPDNVRNYLSQLHSAVDKYPHPCIQATDMLVGLQRKMSHGSKLGNDSIVWLCSPEQSGLQNITLPLFVLTNNYDVMNRVSAGNHVSRGNKVIMLTPKGMMGGICDNKLHSCTEIGLHKDLPLGEIMHALTYDGLSIRSGSRKKTPIIERTAEQYQRRGEVYSSVCESTTIEDGGKEVLRAALTAFDSQFKKGDPEDFPFFYAMGELAKDLNIEEELRRREEERKRENDQPPPKVPSALERFRAKFIKVADGSYVARRGNGGAAVRE